MSKIGEILVAMALAAAWPAAAQERYPLRAVEVVGAERLEAEAVVAASGLRIGEKAGKPEFDAAIARLNEAGVFETIEYRYGPRDGGYEVVFNVREVKQVYPLRLDGFETPADELLTMLRAEIPLLGEAVPGDGPMVTRIGNRLQKHWIEAGRDSKIIGRLAPIEGGKLSMLFQPETALETIAFVTFKGAEIVDPLDLQRTFNPVAMGEPYSPARLRELLEANVRPLFEEQGRMATEFCPCTTEPDKGSDGLLVQVEVRDGPQYLYGKIEPPDVPGMEPADIAKIFKFESGERVDMKQVRAAQTALDLRLRRNGFLRADTKVRTDIDHDRHVVDVAWETTPGSQYRFTRVNIVGLDILSEPVVRKRWGIQPGQPFDPGYPGFFLDRIKAEQMFDRLAGVDWRQKIDEARKTVEVTLIFLGEGAKPPPPEPVEIEQPFP